MLIARRRLAPLIKSLQYNINLRDKFLIIDNPKDYTKLVFDSDGRCKIFEHQGGEQSLKQMTRGISFVTILNTILSTLQNNHPMFGGWTAVSFNMCMLLGYLAVFALNSVSKRIIRTMYIHKNLRFVDITFFNAFWTPKTRTFHISEFQEPTPSYADFTKFQITSLGNAWINTYKNKFKSVEDYDKILNNIFRGIDLVPQMTRSKPNRFQG